MIKFLYEKIKTILKIKKRNPNRKKVEKLFEKLDADDPKKFPQPREKWEVPTKQGVYIIRKGDKGLHVGRTLYGKKGLKQRLKNHLYGKSSFYKLYLKPKGETVRQIGFTYQYLVVDKEEFGEYAVELRARLEVYATAKLWPKHIGTGKKSP